MVFEVTARQLNRATLQRQMLLGREPLDVVSAVRRIVALQAQEAPSPYIALWNRLAGFGADDLDRAFADQALIKASLMRITLHAVAAGDYPAFHSAVTPVLRAARLNDRRFRVTGLSHADADALVDGLVAFAAAEPRSKADIEAHLAGQVGGGELHEGVWWALRTFAPLVHAPVEPPWSFGRRPAFQAPPEDGARPSDDDAALRHLIARYLAGFGPASVNDFGQFTMLPMSIARPAFDAMGDELRVVDGRGGGQLFDLRDAPALPDPDVPAPPRLMAMWDSILLAYADRSRVIPEEYRSLVIRRNGDVLPTVLVDGFVAGVWRPAPDDAEGRIEVSAFRPFDDDTWGALEVEAAALRSFVADRDPQVYSRYGRWWTDLPFADRRLLH